MRILRLQAESFKRIVAVDITPEGNLVEITGKNGNGKTSTLDAIWAALGGLAAAPKQPIRRDALESRIVLTLGESAGAASMVVTRTFRPNKDGTQTTSTLKIENAEGATYRSPQTLLDGLLGALTFDPLAFDRMDPAAQFDTLRRFVPAIDFEAIEMANRTDYDKRTAANRRAKEARAALAGIQVNAAIASRPIVDEGALVAKLEEAGKHNAGIAERRANRQKYRDDIDRLHREVESEFATIKRLEEEIITRKSLVQRYEKESAEKQARLDAAGPLPEPIDTTALSAEIGQARQANELTRDHCRRKAEHERLIKTVRDEEEAALHLTEAIDLREVNKRKAIAEAKLPVEGISFGTNEVLLGGVPWSQASDAERLVASMQIAMSMNPKLRIIRVRDGSLLDEDSLKLVAAMAAKHDYQVWMERVDSSGKVGVVIEDGRVKAQEGIAA